MRFHLNPVAFSMLLLATATALNASEVRVWSDTTQASAGVFAVPAGLNNAVAVAAIFNHVVALRDTGAVVAWGDTSKGQCTVPVAALTNVTAIYPEYFFSFALKSDGSLVGWGDNTRHVLDIPAGGLQVAQPTEEEWEEAARAGGGIYPFDPANLTNVARERDSFVGDHHRFRDLARGVPQLK